MSDTLFPVGTRVYVTNPRNTYAGMNGTVVAHYGQAIDVQLDDATEPFPVPFLASALTVIETAPEVPLVNLSKCTCHLLIGIPFCPFCVGTMTRLAQSMQPVIGERVELNEFYGIDSPLVMVNQAGYPA